MPIAMEKGSALDVILILLVDAGATNSAYLSNLLLEFNYGVICDTPDETTFLRGRSCGAVLVLAHPLCFHDIENLWRHCSMKDRHVRVDSLDLRVESVERDSCESSVTAAREKESVLHESGGISHGHKKRKVQELEKDQGLSVEQPLSFVWTPFIQSCFDIVIQQLGLYNASPLEVFRRVNAPGLTLELVMERMQQYDNWLKQQLQKPQFEMISPFPSYLNSPNQPLVGNTFINHLNNASTTLASTHGWRSYHLQNPNHREQLERMVDVKSESMVSGAEPTKQVQEYPQQSTKLMSVEAQLGALPSTLELPPALLRAAPPTIAAEGFGVPSVPATTPMLRQQCEDEIENMELAVIDSNGAI